MNRSDPNFFEAFRNEEEVNSFLDDLFSNLFDSDDLSSDCDKVFDLANFD